MLRNFKLAAIVGNPGYRGLYAIPLHQQLQRQLAENWQDQLSAFLEGTQEIEFNPGYRPSDHERFCLQSFELPNWLLGWDSGTLIDLESIRTYEGGLEDIKGIAAFGHDGNMEELILFQNFSRSHIIGPGRFLFLEQDTYTTSEQPALNLGQKLDAVYLGSEAKLLFSSFRTVNTFLPLAEFYQEASEQDIREVLSHDRISAEDPDGIVNAANQWFRKRFAMLRDSGILDSYSAEEIKEHSSGYEVSVEVENEKIVFPSDKDEAKRLLQFLNEEIFRGAITEILYETNSKREAD